MVIVDTGSTDDTPQLARSHGAEVHHLPWPEDFSAARNAALKKATGKWVLVLDADEVLVHAEVLQTLCKRPDTLYQIKIVSETAPHESVESYAIRLFPNHPTLRFTGIIHEQLNTQHVPFEIQRAEELHIHHTGYLPEQMVLKQKIQRNLHLIHKSLKVNPRNGFQWFNLGVTLHTQGHLTDAKTALEKGLKESPPEATYLSAACALLLNIYIQQEQLKNGLQFAHEHLSTANHHPDYWLNLGTLYLHNAQPEQAISAFEKALALKHNPAHLKSQATQNWQPLAGLGMAYRQLGQHTAALKAFEEASGLAPDHPSLLLEALELVLELFLEPACALTLERATRYVEILEQHRSYLTLIKQARYVNGLMRYYEQRLKQNPVDVPALLQLGWLLKEIGAYPEALQCFEQAWDAGDQSLKLYNGMGGCLTHMKRYSEAAQVFELARALNHAG